jgi:hypothetical protein
VFGERSACWSSRFLLVERGGKRAPPNHHIFPQTPSFLLGGPPGRERVRRAALRQEPAILPGEQLRGGHARQVLDGLLKQSLAAALAAVAVRVFLRRAAKKWLGRSRKRRLRFSCAELGSVAVRAFLAQRSTELAAAAVRAFLAQRSAAQSMPQSQSQIVLFLRNAACSLARPRGR